MTTDYEIMKEYLPYSVLGRPSRLELSLIDTLLAEKASFKNHMNQANKSIIKILLTSAGKEAACSFNASQSSTFKIYQYRLLSSQIC